MQFWKMNGTGNDFIIVNNLIEHLPHEVLPALARRVCERHLSLGADGLMVVEHAEKSADYRMLFYNADGSAGEMCGNGARCLGRYAYENGLAGVVQTVETPSGTIAIERLDARYYRVRLNSPTAIHLAYPVTVDNKEYTCSYVELGAPPLPHALVPMVGLRDIPSAELLALGRSLRFHPAFPKGANITFYEPCGDTFFARTYERGVEDFTYACGTGAGALALVLTLQGKANGSDVRIETVGGELMVDVVRQSAGITGLYLTGSTNIVAKGELTDEELRL